MLFRLIVRILYRMAINMLTKTFKKIMCCVLLSILIFSAATIVITPKAVSDRGGTMYYQGKGFSAEPENSLDIMFFGNSDVYSGIIPAKLYSDFGCTSYASGATLQTIGKINTLLDEALLKQNPKIVVLDVDCLYQKGASRFDRISFACALFQYHARWKDLKTRDFYTIPKTSSGVDDAKGFVFSNDVVKFDAGDYMGQKDAQDEEISESAKSSVEHFIKKCRESGAQVVFMELPSVTSWTYARHNYITKLASDNDVPFIDMNEGTSSYKSDFSKDFRDEGDHLNAYGAEKATDYIGSYLAEEYPQLMKETKTQAAPTGWNEAVASYKNETNIL